MPNLADLRRDFASHELLESTIADDPLEQFKVWFDEALAYDVIDANAMTVATVGPDGRPSVRVVLLKGYDHNGFVFFTNYGSKKGTDLIGNPNTVFHFFWPQLDRQIGIYGSVEKTSREESAEYFNSRPVDSRIGAWASAQSSVIVSREELEQRFSEFKEKFGDEVPLPDFWGGFRLTPTKFEFWQGRQNRLHDRIVYALSDNAWAITRLSP